MDQSTRLLDIELYCYAGESAMPALCEDWIPVEVDARGNPIGECEDAAPNPPPPEEQIPEQDDEERFAALLSDETRRSYEEGYEKGSRDGLQAERAALKAAHSEQMQRLAAMTGNLTGAFAQERDRYFERLEQEAVKLAMAVAGRILRREALMDPLFLLGAVRVALGQVTSSTKVRLRVPSADAELWTDAMALLPNRDTKPEVTGVEGMAVGECVMETEFGSADLGVRAQLGEIERSAFDRASDAPGPNEPEAARR
jgi:flagellar assembly protein FliH